MDHLHPQESLETWSAGLSRTMRSVPAIDFNTRRTAIASLLERQKLRYAPPNSSSPLYLLPSAVLHRVLDHSGADDRLRLSQTFQRLRDYTLAHPEFWNEVSTALYNRESAGSDGLQWTELLLSRSASRPLNLVIRVNVWDDETYEGCLQLVSVHLERITDLNLDLSLVHINRDDFEDVHARALRHMASRLSSPAPALLRLRIFVCEDCCEASVSLATSLFNGSAPNLARCSIKNISLTSGHYGAWSNIVTFVYQPRTRAIDQAVLDNLLVCCPRLHNLKLTIWHYETSGASAIAPSAHASLRNIGLTWLEEGFEAILTRFLHLPVQTLLFRIPPEVVEWDKFLALFSIDHFEVGFQMREADARHLESGQRVRLRFGTDWVNCSVHEILQEPITYAHLTSLALHEFFWPRYRAYPEAPSLASLRIIMAQCTDYQLLSYRRDKTCGIFQATSATAWDLPSLRELRFTYRLSARCDGAPEVCCCRERLAVSLSDVHSFVTSCLHYSAARLASISLAGVDVIDPHPETWLVLLGRLAEDVSFSPGVPPTSADAPRRMWRDGFENMFRDRLFDSRV